jgi:hypothetical protein
MEILEDKEYGVVSGIKGRGEFRLVVAVELGVVDEQVLETFTGMTGDTTSGLDIVSAAISDFS